MQAGLQIYYVIMAFYGFWRWSAQQGEHARTVTTWPLRYHAIALLAVLALSTLTARWLATETQAAWPFLDSATTWASLLATWMMTHTKLENWIYWIVIDAVLCFLFAAQGLYFVALLFAVYLVVSAVGFTTWLKDFRRLAQPT